MWNPKYETVKLCATDPHNGQRSYGIVIAKNRILHSTNIIWLARPYGTNPHITPQPQLPEEA